MCPSDHSCEEDTLRDKLDLLMTKQKNLHPQVPHHWFAKYDLRVPVTNQVPSLETSSLDGHRHAKLTAEDVEKIIFLWPSVPWTRRSQVGRRLIFPQPSFYHAKHGWNVDLCATTCWLAAASYGWASC